jgi:hypothetical protein
MNACVCATSASYVNGMICNLRKSRFESGLYGRFTVMFLALPAVKICAVVFHNGSISDGRLFCVRHRSG